MQASLSTRISRANHTLENQYTPSGLPAEVPFEILDLFDDMAADYLNGKTRDRAQLASKLGTTPKLLAQATTYMVDAVGRAEDALENNDTDSAVYMLACALAVNAMVTGVLKTSELKKARDRMRQVAGDMGYDLRDDIKKLALPGKVLVQLARESENADEALQALRHAAAIEPRLIKHDTFLSISAEKLNLPKTDVAGVIQSNASLQSISQEMARVAEENNKPSRLGNPLLVLVGLLGVAAALLGVIAYFPNLYDYEEIACDCVEITPDMMTSRFTTIWLLASLIASPFTLIGGGLLLVSYHVRKRRRSLSEIYRPPISLNATGSTLIGIISIAYSLLLMYWGGRLFGIIDSGFILLLDGAETKAGPVYAAEQGYLIALILTMLFVGWSATWVLQRFSAEPIPKLAKQ